MSVMSSGSEGRRQPVSDKAALSDTPSEATCRDGSGREDCTIFHGVSAARDTGRAGYKIRHGCPRRKRKARRVFLAGLEPEEADEPMLIMVSASQNPDFFFPDLIDETVFFIDTAGPATRKFML